MFGCMCTQAEELEENSRFVCFGRVHRDFHLEYVMTAPLYKQKQNGEIYWLEIKDREVDFASVESFERSLRKHILVRVCVLAGRMQLSECEIAVADADTFDMLNAVHLHMFLAREYSVDAIKKKKYIAFIEVLPFVQLERGPDFTTGTFRRIHDSQARKRLTTWISSRPQAPMRASLQPARTHASTQASTRTRGSTSECRKTSLAEAPLAHGWRVLRSSLP